MFSQWIAEALRHANMSQAEAARVMHRDFGWQDDRSIINKLVKGTRVLQAQELIDLSEATEYPIPSRAVASNWRSRLVSAARRAIDDGATLAEFSGAASDAYVSARVEKIDSLQRLASDAPLFDTFLQKIAEEISEPTSSSDEAHTESSQRQPQG